MARRRFRRQALLVAMAVLLPPLAWAEAEVTVFETVARVTVGVDGQPQEVQGAVALLTQLLPEPSS